MLCKGCAEPIKGIIGETCPVCGMVYVADKEPTEKLKVPLKEEATKKATKKYKTGIPEMAPIAKEI